MSTKIHHEHLVTMQVHAFICQSKLVEIKSIYPVVDAIHSLTQTQKNTDLAHKFLTYIFDQFDQIQAKSSVDARDVREIPSLLAYTIERFQHLDEELTSVHYFLSLPNNMYRIAVHAVRIMETLTDKLDDQLFYALESKVIKSCDVSSAAAAYQIATQYAGIANTDGLIACIEKNANPLVAHGLITTIKSLEVEDQLGVVSSRCMQFSLGK